HRRVAPVRADHQACSDLHRALWARGSQPTDPPTGVQQAVHPGRAKQPERGQCLCGGGEQVEEVPLGHERHGRSAGGQMGELRQGQLLSVPAERDPGSVGMVPGEELLGQAELTQQLLGGGVDGVPSEVSEEVRMLLQHDDVHSGPGEQQTGHEAGRSAAGDDCICRDIHTEMVATRARLATMVNSQRGRPRGRPVARDRLLSAAQRHFLTGDLGQLSGRQLAAEVGVSHSLVNYHFGSRDRLFAAAAALTISPEQVVAATRRPDGGLDLSRLARAVVAVWEHPEHRARLEAMARSFARGDAASTAIADYLERTVVETLSTAYGRRKGATMATSIVGFLFARYVLNLPTFARLSPAEAAALLHRSLQ